MEKIQLRRFVTLFGFLEKAGRAIVENTYKNTDGESFYYPMSDAAERIKQILFPDYPSYFHDEHNAIRFEGVHTFMQDLMDEIEKTLYKYPHDKHIYVGDIIRLLYPVAQI